jgi:hypothetical protein
MEMYVIPIIEMVMEAITQNLTRSVLAPRNSTMPRSPTGLDTVVMNEDGFVRRSNK